MLRRVCRWKREKAVDVELGSSVRVQRLKALSLAELRGKLKSGEFLV